MRKLSIILALVTFLAFNYGCDENSNNLDQSSEPDFLFVQNAESGILGPIEGEVEKLLLTLNNLSPDTVYFSDRPDRITGQEPNAEIINNFFNDLSTPPNAALQIRNEDGSVDVIAVSLLTAEFNAENQSIDYEVTIIPEDLNFYNNPNDMLVSGEIITDMSIMMPMNFGSNSLFIDSAHPAPPGCTFVPQEKAINGECGLKCKPNPAGECGCGGGNGKPFRACFLYLGQFYCCINDPGGA